MPDDASVLMQNNRATSFARIAGIVAVIAVAAVAFFVLVFTSWLSPTGTRYYNQIDPITSAIWNRIDVQIFAYSSVSITDMFPDTLERARTKLHSYTYRAVHTSEVGPAPAHLQTPGVSVEAYVKSFGASSCSDTSVWLYVDAAGKLIDAQGGMVSGFCIPHSA